MNKISEICILSDIRYIPLATNYLSCLCDIIGFSKKESLRMSISLEEALLSTIKNAFPGDTSKEIHIIFETDDLNFNIAIINKGLPYIIENADLNLLEMDDKAQDALGVKMIQGLVDKFIHQSLGMDGQEIRLVKYLEKSVDFTKKEEAFSEGEVEERTFDFRLAKKEELIQISRCIYDEYAYSYPNDSFYYIDRLSSMMNSGKFYPFVSVTDKGEVAATASLIGLSEFPLFMETGAWVVKQRFRKNALMKTLLPFQLEKSEELPLNGVFVECVTHHPATQKVVTRYGFTPLAFYFHCIPEDLQTSFDLPENFRNSLALAVKYYKVPKGINIYPPKIHEQFIKDRYDSISAEVNMLKSDFIATEPITAITTEYSMRRQFGSVNITSAGMDIDKALKSAVTRLRSQKAEAAVLHIDMLNPSCPYIFESAIKCGFVFSGVLPNTGNGEIIIMNHLMGKNINYDWITTIESYGEILNYIKEHDQTLI